ncbi:hypothetical protein FNL56_21505 [Tardiphaga sp. vice304]|uniref:hypothetical protein n=1 Tax=Tardiphaga sp. vice304 TaxID=2592817 RepID=UPI00116320DA|nr:hypothetical protein [Tardiphaga sp. vice304]QDM28400.1 hypothetical protein FNL56_21505 [Tardiphaga sp. vice304]
MNALANELGISPNTVKAAAVAADLPHGRGGFNEDNLRAAVEDFADPARIAGHAASSGKTTLATTSTNTLANARARAEEARADKLELEHRVRVGELVEREAVTNVATDLIAAVRTSLLSLGYRIAPLITGSTDPQAIAGIINEQIRTALRELADPDRFLDEVLS